MSMQSLPTSAVTSHLLSPLTAVLVIGLPCRRGQMKTRGATDVAGALSETWVWVLAGAYVSLQQQLLVGCAVVEHSSVTAGVEYHLTEGGRDYITVL